MAKPSSGAIPDSRTVNGIRITNERNPDAALTRAMNEARAQALRDFPELAGQDVMFNTLTQGDFSKQSVLGVHNSTNRRITISNDVVANRDATNGWTQNGSLQHVAAHELGHSLSRVAPVGFVSSERAFDKAFRQFKKSNPRASEKQFARSISNYAAESKREAFAEAFADFNRNGRNATLASRLIMEKWRA